jgi:hypothetical protein
VNQRGRGVSKNRLKVKVSTPAPRVGV